MCFLWVIKNIALFKVDLSVLKYFINVTWLLAKLHSTSLYTWKRNLIKHPDTPFYYCHQRNNDWTATGHEATHSSHTTSQPPLSIATTSHDHLSWLAITVKLGHLQIHFQVFMMASVSQIWYHFIALFNKHKLKVFPIFVCTPNLCWVWQKRKEMKPSPLCSEER